MQQPYWFLFVGLCTIIGSVDGDEHGDGEQNPLYSHSFNWQECAHEDINPPGEWFRGCCLCRSGEQEAKGKQQRKYLCFCSSAVTFLQHHAEAERGMEPSYKLTNWSRNTQLDWHLSGKYFISIGDNLTWDMDKWEAQRTYCSSVQAW